MQITTTYYETHWPSHYTVLCSQEFRSSYCNEPRTSANPRFPFTRHPELVEQQWKLHYANEYPPQCTNPFVTYRYPPLMTSFRAHLQAVTDLQFIDNGEMIVSSSLDASLRLWRVRGQFIGIFDRKIPWSYAKQTPAATWWPNLRIGGVPVPKIRHKADTLKKPGQEPKRRSSRKPSQDLEAAERKKREAQARAKAQAESADRERRHTKMANHIPADVRRQASATTLRVMQEGGVGRWKDMHRYVYVWYPFAKMLYGSNIPVDDRTREEVERDEVLKEFEAIIQDHSDINNMLPTRKRENILGKNFSSGRRHQPLPLLKEITHHPPTQYSVYQSLPCHTLFPVERRPRPPSTIVELRERRRAEHSAINQKGQQNTGFNRSNTGFNRRRATKPHMRRGLPSLVSPSVTSQVEPGDSETSSDAPCGSLSADGKPTFRSTPSKLASPTSSLATTLTNMP
ncbi:hypothetical protein LSAT2_013984 [Lamellibrachia satsuma]|nr:hypothetical protein LSAT2_013984 [Lamellibrachia satsuma]